MRREMTKERFIEYYNDGLKRCNCISSKFDYIKQAVHDLSLDGNHWSSNKETKWESNYLNKLCNEIEGDYQIERLNGEIKCFIKYMKKNKDIKFKDGEKDLFTEKLGEMEILLTRD